MAEEQTQEQAGQAQAQTQPAKVDEAAVLGVLADGEPKRCTMTVSDFVDCGNTAEVLLMLAKLQTDAKVEQVRNPRMAQDGVEFAWQLIKKEEEPKQEAKEEAPSGEQQEAAKPEGEESGGTHS